MAANNYIIKTSLCLLILSLSTAATQAQRRSAMDEARDRMVDDEIVAAGVKNERVIKAMRNTPRHEFVPLNLRRYAYYDMALPIGESQTISPPFVVAYMTESLDPQPTDKVLEIGTGSGYQAAVLANLVRSVYSIEIVEPLGRKAAKTLERLRYDNVKTKVGDGYLGWPEYAPFDKIIVTCSPEKVPLALVQQLKEGGRLVIPVGERYQQTLYLMKKVNGKMVTEALQPTLFVPMTGRAEARREVLPDPSKPALFNGDFELVSGDPPVVEGWHYQRQMKAVKAMDAPQGDVYIQFSNETPGRGSQALQGFAVDGLKVQQLKLSVMVRGKNLRQGQNAKQLPCIIINFFDENRAAVGTVGMGPWRGSFDWRQDTKIVPVPRKAREAVLSVGLLGAIGELALDDLRLSPVEK